MLSNRLILKLQSATGPNRNLDVAIGTLLGYRRKPAGEKPSDAAKSPIRYIWIYPDNSEGPLPTFTASIEQAALAAAWVSPAAAVAWESGKGSARIEQYPPCQAKTPALALCLATVIAKLDMSH